ncbi:MAG: glycosyl transferase family 1, partial [Acidimicrobiales bacterium]
MGEQRTMDIGVYGIRGIPSTYSGYETFASVLLPELVERGHRVTAYCRGQKLHESYEGVHCSYLPSIQTKQLDTLSHGAVATITGRARRHDVLLVMNVSNALFTWLPRLTRQPVA